uniref:norbelladine synthase-like isoform X1 n=1 Tax=Erigeron canadensis TaxID=72917 RepID=UPI001CB90A23|nr:norbelladine synthase-like isoform X1 [Erigeron canadensis]
MFGTLSEEVEVKVAANKAWRLYNSLELGKLVAKHFLDKLEVIEGDGGVGTILELTYKPVEVKVAASKAWKLYSSLELGKLVAKHFLDKIELVEGDGGVGTILKLTYKPEYGISPYKEKFTKIDNDKMVKEVEIVEGGFLDIGFTLYRVRFAIKANPNDEFTDESCIVQSTIEYEVKEEALSNVSLVTMEPLMIVMNVANQHLINSS